MSIIIHIPAQQTLYLKLSYSKQYLPFWRDLSLQYSVVFTHNLLCVLVLSTTFFRFPLSRFFFVRIVKCALHPPFPIHFKSSSISASQFIFSLPLGRFPSISPSVVFSSTVGFVCYFLQFHNYFTFIVKFEHIFIVISEFFIIHPQIYKKTYTQNSVQHRQYE